MAANRVSAEEIQQMKEGDRPKPATRERSASASVAADREAQRSELAERTAKLEAELQELQAKTARRAQRQEQKGQMIWTPQTGQVIPAPVKLPQTQPKQEAKQTGKTKEPKEAEVIEEQKTEASASSAAPSEKPPKKKKKKKEEEEEDEKEKVKRKRMAAPSDTAETKSMSADERKNKRDPTPQHREVDDDARATYQQHIEVGYKWKVGNKILLVQGGFDGEPVWPMVDSLERCKCYTISHIWCYKCGQFMCWTCQMTGEATCTCKNDDRHVEDKWRRYREEDPFQHLFKHPRLLTRHRHSEENKEMAGAIQTFREQTSAIQTATNFLKDLLGDAPLRNYPGPLKLEIAATLEEVARQIKKSEHEKESKKQAAV